MLYTVLYTEGVVCCAGCPDGMKYLVIPFCDGGDLEAALPRLEWTDRLNVMIDAFVGLDALHKAKFLQ